MHLLRFRVPRFTPARPNYIGTGGARMKIRRPIGISSGNLEPDNLRRYKDILKIDSI